MQKNDYQLICVLRLKVGEIDPRSFFLVSCRRRLQLMRVRTITSKPHLTLQFSDEKSNTEIISQKNQYGIRPGSDNA